MFGLVAFVLATEFVGAAHRGAVCTTLMVAFPVGEMFVAMLAVVTPPWRQQMGFAVVPFAVLVAGSFLLSESPRWLVAKGLPKQAGSVFLRVAHINGVNFAVDDDFLTRLGPSTQDVVTQSTALPADSPG